ncbi:phosphate/phosphite/phosphonate ABC transporter substrate-binding protein [Endothiovibrio diazotrophicus]
MPQLFSVSPDFNTKFLPGWYILNTWLQRTLDMAIHFELFDDFEAQHKAIVEGRLGMLYVNPYDATTLVREHGFIPVVRPSRKVDEGIIATRADSPVQKVEDLAPGCRIATTKDPDVHMICMIMLEPADLGPDNVEFHHRDNYIIVAKELLSGDADIGFFLADTYNDLSALLRKQLRVVIHSHIHMVHHLFVIHPQMRDRLPALQRAMTEMGNTPKGQTILQELNIEKWERVGQEEVEFMIDLMDTLEP